MLLSQSSTLMNLPPPQGMTHLRRPTRPFAAGAAVDGRKRRQPSRCRPTPVPRKSVLPTAAEGERKRSRRARGRRRSRERGAAPANREPCRTRENPVEPIDQRAVARCGPSCRSDRRGCGRSHQVAAPVVRPLQFSPAARSRVRRCRRHRASVNRSNGCA